MPYSIVDAGSLYYSAYDMGTLSVPVQVGGAVGGSDPVDLFKASLSGLSDLQINLSGLLPGQDVDLGGSLPPQFTVSAVSGHYDVRAIRRLVRRVVPRSGRHLRRRAAGFRRRHAVERAAEFQYWRIRRHPHRSGGGRFGNRADGKLFLVSPECLERYNRRFEHRLWFDRERRHGY